MERRGRRGCVKLCWRRCCACVLLCCVAQAAADALLFFSFRESFAGATAGAGRFLLKAAERLSSSSSSSSSCRETSAQDARSGATHAPAGLAHHLHLLLARRLTPCPAQERLLGTGRLRRVQAQPSHLRFPPACSPEPRPAGAASCAPAGPSAPWRARATGTWRPAPACGPPSDKQWAQDAAVRACRAAWAPLALAAPTQAARRRRRPRPRARAARSARPRGHAPRELPAPLARGEQPSVLQDRYTQPGGEEGEAMMTWHGK